MARTGPGPQCHHQHPLDVIWAEPLSTQQIVLVLCNGTAYCRLVFLCLVMVQWTAGIGLSSILAKLYSHCCFLMERNHFLYNFAVGLRPADPLLADVTMPLSPAIGPTLGASFCCCRLQASAAKGWLSCSGSMVVYRDKHTDLMVMEDLLYWTRVWSLENSQLCSKRVYECTTEQ